MKLIVVDIQGFNLPEFYAKEISFVDGSRSAHYLLKTPIQYSELNAEVKKQVRYLECFHHGLEYNSGYINYEVLDDILRDHLLNGTVDVVYVKGHQKHAFLEEKIHDLAENSFPVIINVENINEYIKPPPNFVKDFSQCMHHSNNNFKYMCSVRNSLELYHWLRLNLPQ